MVSMPKNNSRFILVAIGKLCRDGHNTILPQLLDYDLSEKQEQNVYLDELG